MQAAHFCRLGMFQDRGGLRNSSNAPGKDSRNGSTAMNSLTLISLMQAPIWRKAWRQRHSQATEDASRCPRKRQADPTIMNRAKLLSFFNIRSLAWTCGWFVMVSQQLEDWYRLVVVAGGNCGSSRPAPSPPASKPRAAFEVTRRALSLCSVSRALAPQ